MIYNSFGSGVFNLLTGDEVILCNNVNTYIVSVDAVGAVEAFKSMDVCNVSSGVNGCNMPVYTPNTSITYVSCGTNAELTSALGVMGFRTVRFVALADTTLTLQTTETFLGNCWMDYVATGASGGCCDDTNILLANIDNTLTHMDGDLHTANTSLTDQTTLLTNIDTNIASLLTEALKQKDFEPILLQDCDGTLYIMRKVYDQTSGTYAIDFVDIAGAAYVPTCANPVAASDIELIEGCFEVVNAFGGYVVGDILTRVVVYDTTTSTVLSTFFVDALGVSVNPLLTDVKPCSDALLLQQIIDNQEDQEALLAAINNNVVTTHTILSNVDSTLTNVESNTQGTIVAINNLDASLSTEIQDATTAIVTQTSLSSNAIITAINNDLDYIPTDTVVYWTAINAGTGYAIGDLIKEETTKKYEDNILISSTTVYTNMNTAGIITPMVADLGALGGTSTTTNQDNIVKLYDVLSSGEVYPFYMLANSDGNGNLLSYLPINYTILGSVYIEAPWTNIGYQSLMINDVTVVSLTPPPGANHADVSFIGTTGPLDTPVDYAWYQINNAGPAPTNTSGFKALIAGQSIDLQGVDEINEFQIICGTGLSGTINVNYKYNPNMSS